MDEADELRTIERARLRALVGRDIETAERLHADDFRLITPLGFTLTKSEYLGAIATGQLRYSQWKPDDIAVRLHADSAAVRYRATLANVTGGANELPASKFWHTDLYERRNGHWQVVWSQATGIVANVEGNGRKIAALWQKV